MLSKLNRAARKLILKEISNRLFSIAQCTFYSSFNRSQPSLSTTKADLSGRVFERTEACSGALCSWLVWRSPARQSLFQNLTHR